MAKIVRRIEDVTKITSKSFVIELEELELIGDNGETASFKISSLIPLSAEKCAEIDNEVDWDKRNFHLLVCPVGVEIK